MSNRIQSIVRAASILKFLSERQDMVGVSEIARNVDLGKSTTHRLLSTLCHVGYVRTDSGRGRYALGFGLLRLTGDWLQSIEVRMASLPVLRRLRQQTGETVSLNLRDADTCVPIESLDSQQAIRHIVELGRPQPLHSGAGGKVILAFLPEDEIEELIAAAELEPARTQALRKQLALIRQQGSGLSRGERVPGACAVSAPISNRDRQIVGSVSVLCVDSTLDDARAAEFGRLVLEAAGEISAGLGRYGPALASPVHEPGAANRGSPERTAPGSAPPQPERE